MCDLSPKLSGLGMRARTNSNSQSPYPTPSFFLALHLLAERVQPELQPFLQIGRRPIELGQCPAILQASFHCALLIMLRGVKTKNAVGAGFDQPLQAIPIALRNPAQFLHWIEDQIENNEGKLPSRKSRSAAWIASVALRQRTQSRCRNALPLIPPEADGSNESRPSINAMK